MDEVVATHDWGGGALLKFHERVKDAPGKSGIRPERLRGQSR